MNAEIIKLADGKQLFRCKERFTLTSGDSIPALELAYETYGELNAQRDNAILIHHALSTSSHCRSHQDNDKAGWWEKMIGPNGPLDTQRYFIICVNNLGSCHGSSGPLSINPQTDQAYGQHFPQISIEDIAHSQALLLNYLGISVLHAIIGPSMGAMISLSQACLYPAQVKHLISISSCARSYPSNIALRTIQRDIIRLDQQWQQQQTETLAGFHLARKLAHLSYRNSTELNQRFAGLNKVDPQGRNIHTYLDYNANKFIEQFDVNSYLLLTQAMDDFTICQNGNDPLSLLKQMTAKVLVIAVSSDSLFEPFQQQELYHLLQAANIDVELEYYESDYGHDAFLVEDKGIGQLMNQFINN